MLAQEVRSDPQSPVQMSECIGVLSVRTFGRCMYMWVFGLFNDIIVLGLEVHRHASNGSQLVKVPTQ